MGGSFYNQSARTVRAVDSGYHTKHAEEIFSKKLHPSMDPKGVTLREARDSEAHPNSIAIILGMDVTGSMGRIPYYLIKEGLPKLMGTLNENGVADAALMFTAVGDHLYDRVPLQISQFESGDAELDMWLERTYLEGGGGGNGGESYMLPWYFAATTTKIDCMEKRGRKGYLFTIGDEPCHPTLSASAIKEITGAAEARSWKTEELLEEARKTYNVYHLCLGSNSFWTELLGENCIKVDDYTKIPEIMSKIITANEGSKPVIKSEITSPKNEGSETVKITL
jgi:hypothetical protein